MSLLVATAMLAREVSLAHTGLGFLSEVLNTSLGTNEPPLVYDLQSRGVDPDRFRRRSGPCSRRGTCSPWPLFVANGEVTGAGLVGVSIAAPAWLADLGLGRPARPHVAGPASGCSC